MTTSLDPVVEATVPKPSRLSGGAASVLGGIRSFRSSSGTLPIGLGVLGFLVLMSLVSLIWTPYPPTATGTGLFSSAPSAAHWFGTDSVGSDVFSRTIAAGRTDVFYTVTAVAIALVFGSTWGAIAGFFGGWFETVTLRLLEVVQAFPALLMALLVISILGPGTFNVILVIAIIPLPDFVRLARAEVLTKKTWQFAEAARLVGNRPLVVLFKHLMPNSWRPLLAYASISAAWVCGNIAALGFIGVGIQPDAVEWGSMIARGESDVVAGAWWEALFPGLGVLVLAIGFQLVGDGIAARNRGEQR
jgi:peptide/nickel transport system permease protein